MGIELIPVCIFHTVVFEYTVTVGDFLMNAPSHTPWRHLLVIMADGWRTNTRVCVLQKPLIVTVSIDEAIFWINSPISFCVVVHRPLLWSLSCVAVIVVLVTDSDDDDDPCCEY